MGVMPYHSGHEPMPRVPEVALITLTVGTRIGAPEQNSFPERHAGLGCSQVRDSHLKRHC